MKKFILICFLGYLFLFGSTTIAKVADSPGADFLHSLRLPAGDRTVDIPVLDTKAGPSVPHELRDTHRSGETCSDTLPEQNGLVDHSAAKGQEGESSSASSGALIYGELIDPDSLGPLSIDVMPYYLSRSSDFMKEEVTPELESGTFFDGVVDPRAKKFLVHGPVLDRPIYISLKLGTRILLDKFLLFPSDSIKVSINLQDNFMVFGGPDASGFEVQYQLNRLIEQERFARTRKIVLGNAESLLDQQDYRQQWETQQQVFGARLEFESFNKDGFETLLSKIEEADQELAAHVDLLARWEGELSAEKFELLRLEILGKYYQPLLSRLYRFYLPELPGIYSEQELTGIEDRISALLKDIPTADFSEISRSVSYAYMDMELDRLTLLALLDESSFLDVLNRYHAGELADRLAAGFLTQNLSSYAEPESMLSQYLSQIESQPWKAKVISLKAATVPGDPMIDLELQNLDGDTLAFAELKGKPSLLYFYFSTCPHSAHYFKDMLFPLYLDKAKAMGINLIAVSVDADPELWHKQLDDYSDSSIPNYRMLPKSKTEWNDFYEISGYPTTFFVDENGVIRSFGLSRTTYDEFESDFLRLAKELDINTHLSQSTNAFKP